MGSILKKLYILRVWMGVCVGACVCVGCAVREKRKIEAAEI